MKADSRFGRLLLTCEHGGNHVPARYAPLFDARRGEGRKLLVTHRGWDPGALIVARRLAKSLRVPLVYAVISRLVIDLNRSETFPSVFSKFTGALSPAEKERITALYYRPHRADVEQRIAAWVERGESVLHVAVHSFTPKLDQQLRNAELGLLYDPKRAREAATCLAMKARLEEVAPELRVRRNYPYVGYSDGLTTSLRRRFPARFYAGIEIEINQSEASTAAHLDRVCRALEAALRLVVG